MREGKPIMRPRALHASLPSQVLHRSSVWARLAVLAGVAGVSQLSCGGEEPFDGVTYAESVRPIFNRRCTTCHRPGGPSGVDIRNPFSEEAPPNAGLVRARTQWKLRNPSLSIPDYNIEPGDPDNSFLIYKIADPSLGLLPEDPDGQAGPAAPPAGSPMPLQVPALSAEEIALIEDWVSAGAPPGDFTDGDSAARSFEADIRPIFGVEDELNQVNGVCAPGRVCARCVYCHYDGTPNPPNLSDPFGPDGVVGVVSTLRTDLKRVEPGDPERSLLIQRIRPNPPSEYGSRMPYSFRALSQDEVDLVEQWISDGARP